MKYSICTLRNERSDDKGLENIPQVYIKNNNNGKNANERKKKIAYSSGFACPPWMHRRTDGRNPSYI